MAENDIIISDMTELLESEVTDATILTCVEGPLNYKVLVGTLKNIFATLPYFATAKTSGVTITDDTYEEVLRLTLPEQPIGTYRIEFDITAALNSTTSSMFMRYSLDGGTVWTEYQSELKDTANVWPISYGFPKAYAAPITFDIVLEFRKGTAGDIMTVDFADVSVTRKA